MMYVLEEKIILMGTDDVCVCLLSDVLGERIAEIVEEEEEETTWSGQFARFEYFPHQYCQPSQL